MENLKTTILVSLAAAFFGWLAFAMIYSLFSKDINFVQALTSKYSLIFAGLALVGNLYSISKKTGGR